MGGHPVKIRFAVLAAACLLSGCATQPRPLPHYAKDGGSVSQEQFLQERYVCLQQAQQGKAVGGGDQYGSSYVASVVTNKQIFISCMGARGYRADADGPLTVPRDAVVMTHKGFGNVLLPDGGL
jgi:uncharacterized lipoprotein YajG